VQRHGDLLSTWEIRHELPGRIRLRNRLIHGKKAVCAAVERALAHVRGVDRYATNTHTSTVLVLYDTRKVQRHDLIQILDRALLEVERGHGGRPPDPRPSPTSQGPGLPDTLDNGREPSEAARSYTANGRQWSRRTFVISGLSLGVAAVGSLVYPPLALLGVPGAIYPTVGLYRNTARSLVRERKVTVDGLTAGIMVATLAAGHIFLFCLTTFVLLCARNLLDKVKQNSRNDYTDIFRLQARTVWLDVDGVEVETSLDAVQVGDLVSLAAGQTIPIDGHVAEGAATVDQHLLTGEAAPVERGVGDAVLALTVVLSGKIRVRVEKTGAATAAAHIARVLDRTVDFKTGRQLRAERMSDRLVWPALVSGALTWPLLGPGAGVALVDAHPKYKATLASSVGLLNYFKLAAQEGVLIKDGRTLELLNEVDTVVFDKTGTLTLAQPYVGRVYRRPPYTADDVLRLAAAAEQHQGHPIARAILQVAGVRGLSIPPLDGAAYRLGYGLTVTIDRRTVCVGSTRLLEIEGIAVPPAMLDVQAQCHALGHSLVLVAIDGEVAGAIELHPSIRPEARRIIQGLRRRHITSMYIISGDHEAPTRRLAEALGIEHYFAETLPENKAVLIEQLQGAGKVVCYVGDGINDSIALKRSHVSVSLHGASTVATDTAEVILLDASLNQLCRLFDIARECKTGITRTMAAVLFPSILCVGGVLLFGVGFAQARILNLVAMATGMGAAMLPLLTHRAAPPRAVGPEPSEAPSTEAPIEECVIA
jgi:Cu2+-exporting ATPase